MPKPSWVTLDKTFGAGGGSVEVTAQKNTLASDRSGKLMITTISGISRTVSITQKRAPIYTITKSGTVQFVNNTGSAIRGTTIGVRLVVSNTSGGPGVETLDFSSGAANIGVGSGVTLSASGSVKTTHPYIKGLLIGGTSINGQIDSAVMESLYVRINGSIKYTSMSELSGIFSYDFESETEPNIPFDNPIYLGNAGGSYALSIQSMSTGSTLIITLTM